MYKLVLLTASALTLATVAKADTVTIGYFDPSPQANMAGIQIIGSNTGAFPIVQLTGLPIFPNTPPQNPSTSFGFDQILAMVIPPGGNNLSGGLGGPNPTFEFTFNDGFAPPQGGTAYLYATWQGTLTGNPMITLPTKWGTIETPQIGTPSYTVTTQVLVCNTPNPFCGPFVGGIASPNGFAGQDAFSNGLRIDDMTLNSTLPSPSFKITEVFAFSGTGLPFAQGDVGGLIMTTLVNQPTPVPGPIVGGGLPGLLALLFGGGALWRRRLATWWEQWTTTPAKLA
jgi:hypothetical protein